MFRYKMMNEKGELLEDTTSGIPSRYLFGSAEIAETLQHQMRGLKSGEQKKITLVAPGVFYQFIVYVDAVREATENEIILGYPVAGIDEICDADCECYHTEQNENTPAERFPG